MARAEAAEAYAKELQMRLDYVTVSCWVHSSWRGLNLEEGLA
jgi:hypothetical protein